MPKHNKHNKHNNIPPQLIVDASRGLDYQGVLDDYDAIFENERQSRQTYIKNQLFKIGGLCTLTSIFAGQQISSLFPYSNFAVYGPRYLPVIPLILKLWQITSQLNSSYAESNCALLVHKLLANRFGKLKTTDNTIIYEFMHSCSPKDIATISPYLAQSLLAQTLLILQPKTNCNHAILLSTLFDQIKFDETFYQFRLADSQGELDSWGKTCEVLEKKMNQLVKVNNHNQQALTQFFESCHYFTKNLNFLSARGYAKQTKPNHESSPHQPSVYLDDMARQALFRCFCGRSREHQETLSSSDTLSVQPGNK